MKVPHPLRSTRAWSLATGALLSLAFLNSSAQSQLVIQRVEVRTDGLLELDFSGDPTSYYRLLSGSDVTRITEVVDLSLEPPLLAIPEGEPARFYRVQQISRDASLDTDGDQIPDVYELLHPMLDPLDPTDAALDVDGSGRTALQVYLDSIAAGVSAPEPVEFFPAPDSFNMDAIDRMSIAFDEQIDVSLFQTSHFQLVRAGPDTVLGTADDLPVAVASWNYDPELYLLTFRLAEPLGTDRYEARLALQVFDQVGNATAFPFAWRFIAVDFTEALVDTDGDGIPDVIEIFLGLNPNDPTDGETDLDGDGLGTATELRLGLNPLLRDTNGNGISDGDEDFDNDGLTTLQEVALGTDPFNPDTDGDGWSDLDEVLEGSDPLDPNSKPMLRVVSPTVSWLNAFSEPSPPPGTTLTVPSGVVSYENE